MERTMLEQWGTLQAIARDIEKAVPWMSEEPGHEIPDLAALLRWADRKVRLDVGE
jgi:hypothetical protein